MTEKEIKNVAEFLSLSKRMQEAGFPLCHNDYGFPVHCESCRELYLKAYQNNKKCQKKTGRGRDKVT
jgi:hypothetical protein